MAIQCTSPLAAQKSEQPSTKTDEEAADKEGNYNSLIPRPSSFTLWVTSDSRNDKKINGIQGPIHRPPGASPPLP